MTVEAMKTDVIRAWGFEHPATLYFFDICEATPNDLFNIEIAYYFAMGWSDEL